MSSAMTHTQGRLTGPNLSNRRPGATIWRSYILYLIYLIYKRANNKNLETEEINKQVLFFFVFEERKKEKSHYRPISLIS